MTAATLDAAPPTTRTLAPLLRAAREAEARTGLQRLLRGDPPVDGAEPWTGADMIRLWALCQLGRPEEVVRHGPAVIIARGDTRGGRMSMPSEGVRASALHTWREVGTLCGEPLPAPHQISTKAGG